MARPGIVVLIVSVLLLAAGVVAPRMASADTTSGASFSFGATGDYGANSNTTAVLDAMAASNLNFGLALGDMSYNEIYPSSSWCSYVQQNIGTLPFELLSGNHESDGLDGYIVDFAKCLPDQMGSSHNFTGTYAQQYYFDYPATSPLARFIMIPPGLSFKDPNTGATWTYDYSKGAAGYTWLANAIDSARAAGIKWIVVGMHKVCLTSGGSACDIGTDLTNLLITKHVDLVLQGHDHNYQRSKQLAINGTTCTGLDPSTYNAACVVNDGSTGTYQEGAGTVFVIDGTGGVDDEYGAIYNNPDSPYFESLMGSNVNPRKGFVKYTVSASGITAQFVGATNTSNFTDSFTIAGSSSGATPTPTTTPAPGSTIFSNNFDGSSALFGSDTNQFQAAGGGGQVTVQSAVADSAPNALGAAAAGGQSAYVYKTYSGAGYMTHTLQFNLQLGSDFGFGSTTNDYMVLAQTLPGNSSQTSAGKVSLVLSGSGNLVVDYWTSSGVQSYVYTGATLTPGKWHTIDLQDTVGAGTGALVLSVDGSAVGSATNIDTGTQPITYFAVGDEYTPLDSLTTGHIYIDDVATTNSSSAPGTVTPTTTPTVTTTPTSTPSPPVSTLLLSTHFDDQSAGPLQTGSSTGQFSSVNNPGAVTVAQTSPASPPNDLAIQMSKSQSSYALKQYSSSYPNHTLQFAVRLDNSFKLSKGSFVLAQTRGTATPGTINLVLSAGGKLQLTYYDSSGASHALAVGYTLSSGAWHTFALTENGAAGTGSVTLNVDSNQVLSASGLNLGTGTVSQFALGELSPSKNTQVGGTLLFDDVVATTLTQAAPTPTATPTTTVTPTPTTVTPTPTTVTPTPTTTPAPGTIFSTNFDNLSTGALAVGSGSGQFTGAQGGSALTVQNAVADSAPNSLAVSLAGGGSQYTFETYAAGYTTHTLRFNIQLGSDFVLSTSSYVVLAQTLASTSSDAGKVNLTMGPSGNIFVDYWDSSSVKHTLWTGATLTPGAWHTLTLHETVSTTTGSLSLSVDGSSAGSVSGVDTGSQPVTYFALGDEYSPASTATAGHIYLDDCSSSST